MLLPAVVVVQSVSIFFNRIQLFQSDSIRINSDTAMMVATRLLMERLMDSNSI